MIQYILKAEFNLDRYTKGSWSQCGEGDFEAKYKARCGENRDFGGGENFWSLFLMMLEIFTPEKYSPLSTKQDAEKTEILAEVKTFGASF